MGITRRSALRCGLGALLTVPFFGASSPKPVEMSNLRNEKPLVELAKKVTQRIAQERQERMAANTALLRKCGELGYNAKAQQEFAELLDEAMLPQILTDTNLDLQRDAPRVPGRVIIDCGSSIDWRLCYAHDARWDVVSHGLMLMTEEVIDKINERKDDASILRHFGVYNDPTVYKMKRMGFYCWAELDVAADKVSGHLNSD